MHESNDFVDMTLMPFRPDRYKEYERLRRERLSLEIRYIFDFLGNESVAQKMKTNKNDDNPSFYKHGL